MITVSLSRNADFWAATAHEVAPLFFADKFQKPVYQSVALSDMPNPPFQRGLSTSSKLFGATSVFTKSYRRQ